MYFMHELSINYLDFKVIREMNEIDGPAEFGKHLRIQIRMSSAPSYWIWELKVVICRSGFVSLDNISAV